MTGSVYEDLNYLGVTVNFRCNLRCQHCLLEQNMSDLESVSFERFKSLFDDPQTDPRRFRGLILTGAEPTLLKDLPSFARYARERGIARIRIQTHGMLLADDRYLAELVNAGINEYFVSVAGPTASSHDFITTVPGSFAKTMRGLHNLDTHSGVRVLTNTVITRNSFRELGNVATLLAPLKNLLHMEFWGYFAMGEGDRQDQLVSFLDVRPYLLEAISRARSAGKLAVVKNYPECLLGEARDTLSNRCPELVIDHRFWRGFRSTGFDRCVHRAACASQHCQGLGTAYTERFGWHENELAPLPAPRQSGQDEVARLRT